MSSQVGPSTAMGGKSTAKRDYMSYPSNITANDPSERFSPLSDIKPGGKNKRSKSPAVGYHRAD